MVLHKKSVCLRMEPTSRKVRLREENDHGFVMLFDLLDLNVTEVS
jgi:hypothetical protein